MPGEKERHFGLESEAEETGREESMDINFGITTCSGQSLKNLLTKCCCDSKAKILLEHRCEMRLITEHGHVLCTACGCEDVELSRRMRYSRAKSPCER